MAVIKNELPVPVAPAAPSTGLQPIQWGALPEVANASPAMLLVDDPDLGVIQVPAGMDPGAFAAATAGARAEAQRKRQMQANMGTLGQIVAPLMEGPTQVYPQAAPVAAMAMGPNYQSFRQGQQQQIAAVAARKAEQERNALLEKQELARLQEREKDRRQRLQVEMMRIKNDKDESAIRQQFERSKMEQERMMADASREDAERARLAKEKFDREKMASREKVAGMRSAARGGGGGGDGVDSKRAAAHEKFVMARYTERLRDGEDPRNAWLAANADAEPIFPEFYLKEPPRGTPVSQTAVGYALDPSVSNEATQTAVREGLRRGDIVPTGPAKTGGGGGDPAPAAQAPEPPKLTDFVGPAPTPYVESPADVQVSTPIPVQDGPFKTVIIDGRERGDMFGLFGGGKPKEKPKKPDGPPIVLDANGIPHVDLGSVLVPVARWAALTPEQQKRAIEDAAKR